MAAEPNVEIQRRKRNMLTHPDSYGQTSGLIFDILNRVFVVMQILDHVLPNISSDSSVDDSNPTRFTATNITEALSKLPEDARQALERNTKWKGYLEEKDRV